MKRVEKRDSNRYPNQNWLGFQTLIIGRKQLHTLNGRGKILRKKNLILERADQSNYLCEERTFFKQSKT